MLLEDTDELSSGRLRSLSVAGLAGSPEGRDGAIEAFVGFDVDTLPALGPVGGAVAFDDTAGAGEATARVAFAGARLEVAAVVVCDDGTGVAAPAGDPVRDAGAEAAATADACRDKTI